MRQKCMVCSGWYWRIVRVQGDNRKRVPIIAIVITIATLYPDEIKEN